MAAKLIPLLALAACSTASVLPRESENPGFLSFPISYARHPLRRLNKRDADAELYNISSVSYLIELGIGTPAQTVKVAIDTGSDELWVDPDCSDSELTPQQAQECQQDGQYTASSSSTSSQLQETNEIPYGIGTVDIQYYTDDIAISGTSAKMSKVQFGVATQSQQLNEGILGLGWGNGKNLQYDNFIDNLPTQGIANSKAFSVALGNVDADNGGVIIFGGVDTKKFSGSLVSNPILGPQGGESVYRYWIQMTAVGITLSGTSKTYTGGDVPIVLDSGSSLSYLPSSIVTAMAQDLQGQYDSEQQVYIVPCSVLSQSGAIDFAFGSVTIQVPFTNFIWQADSQTCVLGAEAVDPSSGVTALLGDTFLRSAFVVFDQTTNTISMAQYQNCGTAEESIPTSGAAGMSSTCSNSSSGSGQKNDAVRGSAGSHIWLAVAGVAGLQLLMSLL